MTHCARLMLLLLMCWPLEARSSQQRLLSPSGRTVRERIAPPEGFRRVACQGQTWAAFLQNCLLCPHGTPVKDFAGRQIADQQSHVAVLDYDVGAKDLQQCADAIIRLRAEYLFDRGRFDRICFDFTSGDPYAWTNHAAGVRPVVSGGKVRLVKTQEADSSRAAFRRYLDIVFTYAGTISLSRELRKVADLKDAAIGDIIIEAGSPGHAVIVMDMATNSVGGKLMLLAQSYMPAQSIHILANPFQAGISPWHSIPGNPSLATARYSFRDFKLGRFPGE